MDSIKTSGNIDTISTTISKYIDLTINITINDIITAIEKNTEMN